MNYTSLSFVKNLRTFSFRSPVLLIPIATCQPPHTIGIHELAIEENLRLFSFSFSLFENLRNSEPVVRFGVFTKPPFFGESYFVLRFTGAMSASCLADFGMMGKEKGFEDKPCRKLIFRRQNIHYFSKWFVLSHIKFFNYSLVQFPFGISNPATALVIHREKHCFC